MGTLVIITSIICLLVATWYLAHRFNKIHPKPSTQLIPEYDHFSDPDTCAQILACTGYNKSGANNQYSKVTSRAIPNERLVRAFNIDNSFTTTDDERRKQFNMEAGKAIKMTEAKWQKVADLAKQLVDQAVSPLNLTPDGQPTSITLDSLIRSVCLKIIIHVLFDKDPLNLDNESILIITESINTLWIQSKGTGTPLESDKDALKEALAKVIPGLMGPNPRENPLNLIMPAYETLWRVILSGFLQVNFVKGASPTWRSVLAEFLASPTIAARKELGHDPEASAASVDHIVKESLRLYPSVKRVYRQLDMDDEPGHKDVAADIEACQRSNTLWGADAERFVPSRWINASDEAQDSYMAFGISPFVCPAKGEFGPMMIGILVAAFVESVSIEDWHLKLGESSSYVAQYNLDKALSGEEPLVSDRSTYEGIRIVRK